MNTATYPSNDSMEMSKKDHALILTLILVILVIAAMAVAGFLFMKPEPDTIQGQGDAAEVRVSGKLPGRVTDIYVEEGQHVRMGDTLVHIHSSLADAKMMQAQAMEEAASAANRKVDHGTRRQIVASAKDLWTQAQAATGITEKTYRRLENLYQQGVVSEQKRDEAKAAYDAARAAESAAKSQYELALSGPQAEDREASSAMVTVAKGGIQEVGALLEDSYLLAPCDGEVTVIFPNVSELIATGAPIMTIQKDDHWSVFNVRETSLKDITLGSTLECYIPALDVTTDMKVFYIKDLGTYANWQATKSTGDFDARTFQIKARPAKPIDNFRPGMSVILKKVKSTK